MIPMPQDDRPLTGAGLGLRRDHLAELAEGVPEPIRFMELAPENWIGVGGRSGERLQEVARQVPLIGHGLSLNLGGWTPLDPAFLEQLRSFIESRHLVLYGDHLSYCADEGQLYDLLPLPFTEEAVHHVAGRIRQVQEALGQRITVENASYYLQLPGEMEEHEFINAVLEEADCLLLIDINNIYVNSVNHGYDPVEFLHRLPGERIAYAHIAGHLRQAEDLIIDTHGAEVIDPVWSLLEEAYRHFGLFPTLLERDFNIPPLAGCLAEVRRIDALQEGFREGLSEAAHG